MARATEVKVGWGGFFRGPMTRGPREAVLIIVSSLAFYMLLSLWTYQPSDPGWSHTGSAAAVANRGGVAGAWLADVFLYLFGVMAYVFPLMVGYGGWLFFRAAPGQADNGHDPVFDTKQSTYSHW